jgi:signal transduction histidine kinase
VDLQEPELISNYRRGLLLYSSIILLLFSVTSMFMLFLVRREERRRKAAESHKDEFLSIISHELRTPLTSIRGALGLIEGATVVEPDEQTRMLAHIATRNCERLSALVDDLLDLRKIESGQFTLQKKPVALAELIRKSISANQGYAEAFDVSFVMHEPSMDVTVNVDGNRIMQVMANLLSNAAKYGKAEDTIEVSISRVGHFVRVAVTDHGDGVPESFRDRIFQRFSQYDASSMRKIGGSGLGLNIVKHIVELHDGVVGLQTQAGAGSTFYFDLPVGT